MESRARQSPISDSSSAAVITAPLNSDRKIGAVGMFADRGRDLTLELGDLRVQVLIVATNVRTSCRRVLSSSSPTRPSAARRSLAVPAGLLPAAVPLAGEEPGEARLAESARVGRVG